MGSAWQRFLIVGGYCAGIAGKPSGEIRLNELRTGVDVDLTQNRVAGIDEPVWSVRRDDDDAAGFDFTCFIADRDHGAAFKRERDLDVRVRVQWRTLAGLRIDDVGRERCALRFANEFIRHPDKRQLFDI
jgi:hypothetical protein